MRSPTVIDLRNIYRPDEMLRRGFNYSSIGRGAVIGGSHPADTSENLRPSYAAI
jgi:hypothetical protein